MATETEEVVYRFEGDIKSLKTATQSAIGMLNKYSASVRKASSSDAFTASKQSMASLRRTIGKVATELTAVQKKVQGVGDVKVNSRSGAFEDLANAFDTITAQLKKLDNVENVSTQTLIRFRGQMARVRDSLQQAAPQVDKLVASKKRLQTIFGSTDRSAGRFRTSMEAIRSRTSETFAPLINRFKSFSTVFSSMSAKIQSFRERVSSAFARAGQLGSTVAAAFRRVAQSTDEASSSASRSASTHEGLEGSVEALSDGVDSEASALDNERRSLESKEPALQRSRSSHGMLLQVVLDLSNAIYRGLGRLAKWANGFKKTNSSASIFKKTLRSLIGLPFGKWFGESIKRSIDLTENYNMFAVAMGGAVEEGIKFVAQMQETYGLDPNNLYKHVGYFYLLTDAIHMSDEASAKMSLTLTKAANDIASLYNQEIGTVVDNLSSGMQGMSKAVRKYGFDVRATTLQTTAAKYGLTQQVESMSEANRMALRYLTMMDQMSNATKQLGEDSTGASVEMGDFARTIESPANQLRIFKEQVTQLGRAIGNFFVRPLGTAIAYVNGFIMAIRSALNFIGSLLGFVDETSSSVDMSSTTEQVESVGSAAGAAADKVKDLLAPFDELNVLQEQQDSGGGGGDAFDDVLDPALEEAIKNMTLNLENIKMKANEVRDSILEFLGFKVEEGSPVNWDSDVFLKNLTEELPGMAKEAALSLVRELDTAIRSADFAMVGSAIGGLIHSALSWVVTVGSGEYTDDTGNVQNLWTNLGEQISTLVVNALKQIDFVDVGKTVALKFTIVADLLAGIGQTLNESVDAAGTTGWQLIGQKVAEAITSFVESAFNADTGAAFGTVALGILKAIITAFANIRWADVGESIAEFINGLDLSAVFDAIIQALSLLVRGIATAFDSLWENANPDTKAAITTVGLLLLGKAVLKIIPYVTKLKNQFNKKNDSLKKQNQLESQAAYALSTEMLPALVSVGTNAALVATAMTELGTSTETSAATTTNSALEMQDAMEQTAVTASATADQASTSYSRIASAAETSAAGVTNAGASMSADLSTVTTNVNSMQSAFETAAEGVTTSAATMDWAVAESVAGMQTSFDAVQNSVADTSYEVEQYTSEMSTNIGGMVAPSVLAAMAVNAVQQQTNSLNSQPMVNFCSSVSSSMYGVATAASTAAAEVSNLRTELSTSATSTSATSTPTNSVPMYTNEYYGYVAPEPADTRKPADTSESEPYEYTSLIDEMRASWPWYVRASYWLENELPRYFSGGGWDFFSAAGAGAASGMFSFPVFGFASGGVVTSPTLGWIGEGKYDEAILPLDNSPQMNDLVQKIADAVESKSSDSSPIEVHVYLGGEEYDTYTYKAAKRGEKRVGKQPIEVGG